ncbi:MAG: DUF296 domain-containing protein [archaeon]
MEQNKIIAMEFEDGEELISGIKNALAENKIQRATIRSVEGRIKNFDLNIFIGGAFRRKHFDEEFKLTSVHGVFFEKGNMGYKGELVVSLAGNNSNSFGGPLLNATSSGRLTIKANINEFK